VCFQTAFQNGDLDFDGTGYRPDWPDGSANHPTSIAYTGPLTRGHTYPNIQFETNVAASEALCDTATGDGCTAPPQGAAFYPFWTLANQQSVCVWNFGNVIAGATTNDFGKTAEYGVPDVARFAGTLTSPVMANPARRELRRRLGTRGVHRRGHRPAGSDLGPDLGQNWDQASVKAGTRASVRAGTRPRSAPRAGSAPSGRNAPACR
jgi:hypothetical protein